jgi:hypothetical protein
MMTGGGCRKWNETASLCLKLVSALLWRLELVSPPLWRLEVGAKTSFFFLFSPNPNPSKKRINPGATVLVVSSAPCRMSEQRSRVKGS